jgi:hypothetical protein
MIVFRTHSQVLNYLKRHKKLEYYHYEGCGCCWETRVLHFNGRRITMHETGEQQGRYYNDITVLGLLRKRRKR